MADNRRQSRMGEQILRDISTMLEEELAEKVPGMVTFTRVRLTEDLRYATVYYSVLGKDGDREKVADYLEREKRRIRKMVGAGLRMRFIPEFAFKFDPSIEESIRIQQLLDEIKSDRPPDE
ncbi:MAG TPA: 30S ribosome-binding factor RbfA [candidate division Zixibacteria bacterium]|nr:30S ribosome-binding factor RbfA [candidate division Zixibacteria bacterium]MDD4918676.1 30S ribosome-binding factor RbfA [candidate division Zixibacteria bacterium]MDM7973097.1 30S ribosome-binding factor RbfA [candidate division Zixibacteria bacterium]HOD67704.1 30S ribosome-binding factor RbfA [candidate division Zixibacteria bacterium]HOZ08437.1 30S ribosome-binding factor RbfA [candidate division Zixibacteria bacterium]